MEYSIFDVIENGVSNKEISEVIVNHLNKKYKKEFIVKMIGNRFGTVNDDTVTTFCCPKNEENLIFTVTLNKEQTKIEDDFLLKRISYELEKEIKDEFKKENIDVIVKSELVNINKLTKRSTIKEFLNEYKEAKFISYIVSKVIIPEEIIRKIFDTISLKYQNINLNNLLYTIDKEKYNNCLEVSKTIPLLTTSIIESYFIIREYIVKVSENNVTLIK